MQKIPVTLTPIGVVHSPYKHPSDVPIPLGDIPVEIELFSEFEQGLQDIDGFSHLHVYYWLHQSKGFHLLVQTPWDHVPHGLFTTRSPHRPNALGYAVVEVLERNNTILRVKGLDAIDNTPVIDIKPYIPQIDTKQDAVSGWTEHTSLGKQ